MQGHAYPYAGQVAIFTARVSLPFHIFLRTESTGAGRSRPRVRSG